MDEGDGKRKEWKRHIVLGVMRNIHSPNIYDTMSGLGVKTTHQKYSSTQGFCADMGYKGTYGKEISKILGIHVDITKKIKPHKWEKLHWR